VVDRINVLDHGYVDLIETWGSDERIIESARMSTNKGFLGWGPRHNTACCLRDHSLDVIMVMGKGTCDGHCGGPAAGDEKLLAYLWNNNHATPFEMAGMIIEVQAPIFVFREWHRHRTQSYNELSARYTPLPDVNYVPSVDRLMINANGANKQAGTITDALPLTEENASQFQDMLAKVYRRDQDIYEWALGFGIPKELARVHLPVGRYSRMRASANLRNWLSFLTLRMAPNAQWEIRQYADAVGDLIKNNFPRTWELFAKNK
jgi:thymidylate synthase (FAD)